MAQYFTKEGLKKMKEELKELKTNEMRKVTKLIAEAAAFGDLKENAAYHDARGMKSFLLGRIEQLENAINEANPETRAKLTIYPGVGHDSWTRTYNSSGMGDESTDYDPFDISIYDWMFLFEKEIRL